MKIGELTVTDEMDNIAAELTETNSEGLAGVDSERRRSYRDVLDVVEKGYHSDASADDDDSPEIVPICDDQNESAASESSIHDSKAASSNAGAEIKDGSASTKKGTTSEHGGQTPPKTSSRRNGFQKYTSMPLKSEAGDEKSSEPRRSSETDAEKDPADRIYDQKHIFSGGQVNGGGTAKGMPWIKNPTAPTRRYSGCCTKTEGSDFPSIFTAYDRARTTDHVQCVFVRHRGTLGTTFELYFETTNRPLLLASKVNFCTTVNYHIFDMTNGFQGETLSKESPNYVGKLRGRPGRDREFVLVNSAWEREEIAAYRFNAVPRGQPRNLSILVPSLLPDGTPTPNRLSESYARTLLDALDDPVQAKDRHLYVFQTKMPFLQNGYYRLDFKGRVPAASTKNVQFVSDEDGENIILQFGKVEQDVYHLDFKAPFNAIQAFGLALCQFEH
jgi:hypothetical protein